MYEKTFQLSNRTLIGYSLWFCPEQDLCQKNKENVENFLEKNLYKHMKSYIEDFCPSVKNLGHVQNPPSPIREVR